MKEVTSKKTTDSKKASAKKAVRTGQKSAKHYRAGYPEGSCVMCGTLYIDRGRILHGHCVCEDCVEYIIAKADTAPSAEDAEQETDF